MSHDADLTDDTLLGGRVRLCQPRRHGVRAGLDAVLLAAAVPAVPGDAVLDVGAGTGAVGLCVAARVPGVRVTLLEVQRSLAGLAATNADRNQAAGMVHVVPADLRALPADLAGQAFDHVATNPPYAAPGTPPPDPPRALALAGDGLGLAEWIDRCLRRLAPGGSLSLIHRADRITSLLAALAGRTGGTVILPLQPRSGVPAHRVVVRSRKAVRSPDVILPPLVLHDPGGGFTPAAEAVLRDAAPLPMP